MNIKVLANALSTVLLFIVLVLVIVDCSSGQVGPGQSNIVIFSHMHWDQVLISTGVGILLGLILAFLLNKREK
jgi:hypothetical protein